MNLYLTLKVFSGCLRHGSLSKLKQAGVTTAILSNGSPQMLKAAVHGAQIDHLLDAVRSVEEVGILLVSSESLPLCGGSPGIRGGRDRVGGTHTQRPLSHASGVVQPLR